MEALTIETRGGLWDLGENPSAELKAEREAELKAQQEAELKAQQEAEREAQREARTMNYDVFLNFRGRDTRHNFTDCLYQAMINQGITTYRDSEELHAGDRIDDLLRAVAESKIYISIFSKGYASSAWCLREIARMTELNKSTGKPKILPIFLDVAPSDVKHRKGLYLKDSEKHEQRYPRVYGKDLKDYVEQVPDSRSGDSERTLYPYVTGTSVLALKYRDGILMAADMGGSYGSTLRYKTIERIKPIGKHSLLGASGEISDFQEILRYLDELILYDNMWDDGNSLGPKEVHNYLTRVMYNRRNKFNPLWNSLVLGGVKNGQKYLGMVSMIGVSFEENHVATGFGNHLARPILRDEWNENLSFEDAVKLLEKCMRVLLYRDRSAVNKLQIVKITEEGTTNFPPYSLKTFWGFESYENPTVGEEGHHLKMTN